MQARNSTKYVALNVENRRPNKYLYKNVHNSTDLNSQKVEIMQICINYKAGTNRYTCAWT